MSKLINISLDVTAIPRESIKPHTNGKKYVSLDVWINDEDDRFGNNCSVNISQSKEEREAKAKKVYVGNGRTKFGFDESRPAAQQSAHNQAKSNGYTPQDDDTDTIPF